MANAGSVDMCVKIDTVPSGGPLQQLKGAMLWSLLAKGTRTGQRCQMAEEVISGYACCCCHTFEASFR